MIPSKKKKKWWGRNEKKEKKRDANFSSKMAGKRCTVGSIKLQNQPNDGDIIKGVPFILCYKILDKEGNPVSCSNILLDFSISPSNNPSFAIPGILLQKTEGYDTLVTDKNGEISYRMVVTQVSSKYDADGLFILAKFDKNTSHKSDTFKIISKKKRIKSSAERDKNGKKRDRSSEEEGEERGDLEWETRFKKLERRYEKLEKIVNKLQHHDCECDLSKVAIIPGPFSRAQEK